MLRANKESILTVVEVFIHDPLYKWGLTPAKANRRQQDGAEAAGQEGGGGSVDGEETVAAAAAAVGSVSLANVDAERTLLRIKQKLEGVEGGEGGGEHWPRQPRELALRAACLSACLPGVWGGGPALPLTLLTHVGGVPCRGGRGTRRGGPGAAAAPRCDGPPEPEPHVRGLGSLGLGETPPTLPTVKT